MAVQIRPWPGREDDDGIERDDGIDLIIHFAPDGHQWLWEIDHVSLHPEHIAAALRQTNVHLVASRRTFFT